jgi:hypothetical protein
MSYVLHSEEGTEFRCVSASVYCELGPCVTEHLLVALDTATWTL